MKIAAADIGGTKIKYCLFDDSLPLSVIKFLSAPTVNDKGGEALIQAVGDLFDTFDEFDAIAICTCGITNPEDGTIILSGNIPGYTGTNVKKILEERFNVPVAVENDVNAVAIGEAHLGAGKTYDDFLCLTYGTGIGGCIIIDKKPYHGANFAAGEFGHFSLHPGGEKCGCGQWGCYERYASTSALTRKVKEKTGREMNGLTIIGEYETNPLISEIVNSWLNEIMIGLASLIHIFNPACIVTGGGIMEQDIINKYLNDNIGKYLMPSYDSVQILKATVGNHAGILGAVTIVKEMVVKRKKA